MWLLPSQHHSLKSSKEILNTFQIAHRLPDFRFSCNILGIWRAMQFLAKWYASHLCLSGRGEVIRQFVEPFRATNDLCFIHQCPQCLCKNDESISATASACTRELRQGSSAAPPSSPAASSW